MTANGLLQIAVFFLVLIAIAKPLGFYRDCPERR